MKCIAKGRSFAIFLTSHAHEKVFDNSVLNARLVSRIQLGIECN
jgi:hypothetical protein